MQILLNPLKNGTKASGSSYLNIILHKTSQKPRFGTLEGVAASPSPAHVGAQHVYPSHRLQAAATVRWFGGAGEDAVPAQQHACSCCTAAQTGVLLCQGG